jgi:hypothetical protein
LIERRPADIIPGKLPLRETYPRVAAKRLFSPENVRLLKAYTRERHEVEDIGEFLRYLIVDSGCKMRGIEFKGVWKDLDSHGEYQDLVCKY